MFKRLFKKPTPDIERKVQAEKMLNSASVQSAKTAGERLQAVIDQMSKINEQEI